MMNMDIMTLNNDLDNTLKNVINNNEIIKIDTKSGNAIIISESNYNNMIATIEISSNSKLKNKIIEGKNSNINECIEFNNIKW